MNIDDLDLRTLRAFVHLVQMQSVSRAADAVQVSQPTMSRLLAALREAMDDPVLVRSGTHMRATRRARTALPTVIATLDRLQAAFEPPHFSPARSDRRFSIAAWDYAEAFVLPLLVRRMCRLAPGVSVESRPLRDRDPVPALVSGDLDLAIGLMRELPPAMHRRPLFSDRFVCMVRADHPRIHRRLTRRAFVRESHLLVAPFGATRGIADRLLEAHAERRHVACYVPHFLTAPEVLRQTDLIATMPQRVARRLSERGGLRVFAPPLDLPEFTVEIVWHERSHDDQGHRWFREQCRKVAPAPN